MIEKWSLKPQLFISITVVTISGKNHYFGSSVNKTNGNTLLCFDYNHLTCLALQYKLLTRCLYKWDKSTFALPLQFKLQFVGNYNE